VTHGGPTIIYFNMNDEHTRNLHTYKKRYCSGEENAIGDIQQNTRQHTGHRHKDVLNTSNETYEIVGLSDHIVAMFAIIGAISMVYYTANFIRKKYVNTEFTKIEGEC